MSIARAGEIRDHIKTGLSTSSNLEYIARDLGTSVEFLRHLVALEDSQGAVGMKPFIGEDHETT